MKTYMAKWHLLPLQIARRFLFFCAVLHKNLRALIGVAVAPLFARFCCIAGMIRSSGIQRNEWIASRMRSQSSFRVRQDGSHVGHAPDWQQIASTAYSRIEIATLCRRRLVPIQIRGLRFVTARSLPCLTVVGHTASRPFLPTGIRTYF
jgi:hypothetical protein